MRLAKVAALAEPSVVEVLHLDREACGDVLGDLVEPFALFARERHARIRLLLSPGVVSLAHDLGKRRERLAGLEGMADERNQVGLRLPAPAGSRRFEFLVAFPELFGRR